MTFQEYQQAAQHTSNTESFEEKITNGIIGLFGEGGEVADIYKKHKYQGHPFSEEEKNHMAIELGDCLWYLAEIATALNVPLDDVAQKNIQKLQKRYEKGFSTEESLNRKPGDV